MTEEALMAETANPSVGDMPMPDMTTSPEPAELSLGPRERQKLDVYRKEHPDADSPVHEAQGEMPNPRMNDSDAAGSRSLP